MSPPQAILPWGTKKRRSAWSDPGEGRPPLPSSSPPASPFPPPRVTLGELRGPEGVIASEHIRLLHASRVHRDEIGAEDGFESDTYSVLGGNPGPDAPHQPVWVLVDIPAGIAPGTYRGGHRERGGRGHPQRANGR